MTIGQPLPIPGLDQISPFLLLHHAGPIPVKAGKNPMHIGAHPHRGFEPVTFVFNGSVEHQDSLGNHSVIEAGGVQWSTAGSGIVHSESAAPDLVAEGGTLEIIQLWINLPQEFKLTLPNYQGLQRDAIPVFRDDNVRINVISGSYKEIKGPVKSLTGITAYTIELEQGGAASFETHQDQNVMIYQLRGQTKINGSEITDKQLIYFQQDDSEIIVESSNKSLLLVVSGHPIEEPLAQYGPFVMNTQQEIMQAVEDYQSGKMGTLDG